MRIVDIQVAIDNSGKNYPTLRKLKLLVSQLYKFAIKQRICSKDISEFIDIKKYKERNPYKVSDCIINEEDIKILWKKDKNEYIQMILILIYTGVQINEFINIKKVNICLSDRYIKIVGPKDNKVLRIIPISHKILPFIKYRMKH